MATTPVKSSILKNENGFSDHNFTKMVKTNKRTRGAGNIPPPSKNAPVGVATSLAGLLPGAMAADFALCTISGVTSARVTWWGRAADFTGFFVTVATDGDVIAWEGDGDIITGDDDVIVNWWVVEGEGSIEPVKRTGLTGLAG